MEDPKDERPIRVRYFAAFVPKIAKNKERIRKFKEVFRDYEKYGPIMIKLGYTVDSKERFEYEVQSIGMRHIWQIDEIYREGNK
jgi:hypothetical protein